MSPRRRGSASASMSPSIQADAQSYFVTDGQKDIAACFERMTSRVIAALKFDWAGNSPNLADCWQKGGTLTISKIYPDQTTGMFDYKGTKGQKIEWEMVPMGELYVEENQIPGEFAPYAFRCRWHHLASRGPLGRHRRPPLRRHRDPRPGSELRSGGLPAVQQGFACRNIRSPGSTRIIGRSSSTRSSPPAMRSASRPTASSSA